SFHTFVAAEAAGSYSSSPCAKRMGRGTMRSMVEGLRQAADRPSTTHRVVPLPIACGDRED
ncbi:MAG TPA: hypothetical protein VF652_02380, partial [Allosphingosinicella sp.]